MTEDEFLTLVEKHQAQLYQHALYLLKNQEDAKDMTQETLIKAWEHRNKLIQETVHSWLLKCLQNLCFNHLKRSKYQVHLTQENDDTFEMLMHNHSPKNIPQPDEILGKHELKRVVHRAVGELPPTMRIIVIMREMDEMSYKEISKIVGKPIGTVKSTVVRARKKLRKILSRYMEE